MTFGRAVSCLAAAGGFCMLIVGVGLVSVPAALVVGGVLLVAWGGLRLGVAG